MIPVKTLVPPARRERCVRVGADGILGAARVKKCVLHSLREENGALVPAAGVEEVMPLKEAYTAYFDADGCIFALRPDGTIERLDNGRTYSFGTHTPCGAVCFALYKGEREYYVLASDRLYRLYNDTYEALADARGGELITVHRERLFVSRGSTLSYSAPLSTATWLPGDAGAGEIALSPTGGRILALQSFAGRLYVFREHELLSLRADADDLDFRFERVHFDGTALPGTVQCVGTGIVFQTARGLAYLGGGSCKLVRGACMAELLAGSAAWRGRYYALAKSEGLGCIYVYDPASDEEYLLDVSAERLWSDPEGVYFIHGTAVYRLTEQGFPPGKGESSMQLELDAGRENGGRRYLSGLTVYGEGSFTAELISDGVARSAQGKAGERMRVMRLLRTGVLNLTLRTADPAARIAGIRLHFEEDRP